MQFVRTRTVAAALVAFLDVALPVGVRAAGTGPAPAGAPPAATAAPAPAPASPPAWGLLVRGGWFGVPDSVAGAIFEQNPAIKGWTAGAEVRYYGKEGPRGVTSYGLAFDHGYASADGIWQADKSDEPLQGSGHATLDTVTLTAYWDILPSWVLHPYFGLGLGVTRIDGQYKDEEGTTITARGWIPALHVPVGLSLGLGERARVAAEARFIDGFAAGGALELRF
ncbi:MAG TPA: hypothetical protein VI078_02875 [bacterium]